jgi:hypothetical protein
MGTAQLAFEGVLWRVQRKWHDRKWRDRNLRDRKLSQSRDRKSRQSGVLSGSMLCACATGSRAISVIIRPFDRKWRQSCERKRPYPEVALTGSRFCACPAFSRAFFLVVVPWLPDVTEGHLTPFGVPWVCATGSCATPVVVVNNVGWECSLWRLRPIIIGNPRVLYLVTGTRPGYLPLLFSYSVKVV